VFQTVEEGVEMVGLTALWLPIVVSAVVVFIASSIIHMFLPYHKKTYGKLPDEDGLLEAMRAAGVGPGQYAFPRAADHKDMASPEMIARYEAGPVGMMTVMPSGAPKMGKQLVLWFVYTLVIGVFVAYLTGRTLGAGAEYLAVHRVAGCSAFLAYAFAHASNSIWKGLPWSATAKDFFDGLVYGLLTGGVFGWLWPSA
jgi:hypothetical protein